MPLSSVPIFRHPLPLATAFLLLLPGVHAALAQEGGGAAPIEIPAAAPSGSAESEPGAAASVAPPDAREVVAWGRAAIGPGGLAGARRAAKAQALRDAVEKGTGVFVSAHTLTHNYQLVHDQVMTHAEGFATLKDVLREVDTPQTVTLWMRAEVSLRPLAQELKALNLTRAWRIRVTATETNAARDSSHDQAVVDALEKTLLDAGFVVVSTDADADIAVHVTPQFTTFADASRDNRAMAPSRRSTAYGLRGEISVRATRAQTGEVVAVLSSSESAPLTGGAAAGVSAVASAVQSVAPRLTDALMLLPARDSQPIQLVVRGIGTAARATHLENLLGNLVGVRSVTRRSFEAGDAVWEMDVLSDAQADLAREMEELPDFKPFHLSVTSDTLAKIVANAPFGRHPAAKPKPVVLAANTVPKTAAPAAALPEPAPIAVVPSVPTSGYRPLHPKPYPADGNIGDSAVTAEHRYRVNPRDGAQMVWIPQGEFQMGDDDIRNNPRHTVMLSGYFIYKDLVTVAMYRRFCEATGRPMPYPPRGGWRDDHPMVNVTFADTCAYCTWAGVRLPTEAEWEKAARGTDGRKFPWGDDSEPMHSVKTYEFKAFGSVNVSIATRGSSNPSLLKNSPFGVADMDGKVAQWCADWYDPNFVHFARPEDPTGPYHASARVVRGCPENDNSLFDFRTARRAYAPPDVKLNTIGFRAVSAPMRWASSGG